jgi:RND family efflux transporter MFP subunit
MTSSIPPSDAEKRHPRIWLSMKIILPIAVLAIGTGALIILIKTAPTAGRQPPPRSARLVEARTVATIQTQAMVSAMGTVQPARHIMLHPEVSGRIREMHPAFIPGGYIQADATIAVLDDADYEIGVRRAESEHTAAQSEWTIEMGLQAIARAEFELLGEEQSLSETEQELVLRVPQLERARARVESAQAALDQAIHQRQRTRITAPFNAIVRERHVNLGSQVTPSTPLASLIDADTIWVLAVVPVTRLPWLETPAQPGETGSVVYTETADGSRHTGYILQRLPHLEEAGRMAQILIEFPAPTADESAQQPLLLGDFVRVEIVGRTLDNVIAAERALLRTGDTIWIMNEDDELEIVPVDILFRSRDFVYFRNERVASRPVILTDLSAPVAGMKLTTNRATTATGGQGQGRGGRP